MRNPSISKYFQTNLSSSKFQICLGQWACCWLLPGQTRERERERERKKKKKSHLLHRRQTWQDQHTSLTLVSALQKPVWILTPCSCCCSSWLVSWDDDCQVPASYAPAQSSLLAGTYIPSWPSASAFVRTQKTQWWYYHKTLNSSILQSPFIFVFFAREKERRGWGGGGGEERRVRDRQTDI